MKRKENFVFVWPICSRIIHWSIAISFIISFTTSFNKSYLHCHMAFGWIFGLMIIYRIIWGFVGPRYATFNTFKLNLAQLKWYFKEKIIDRWRKIPAGHNPASSWFTLIVLFFGSMIVFSGLVLFGVEDNSGIFSYMNKNYYPYMIELSDVHAYLSYFLVFFAIIHIIGVLIEQFYHKTNMVFAMVDGYKKTDGEDTEITRCRNITSFIFIILTLISSLYIYVSDDNILTRSNAMPIDYKNENLIYNTKCGDCHKAYPAYMLPARSWERIMGGLDNHFGEEITDKNISSKDKIFILKYLTNNSAEYSSNKVAVKLLDSLKADEAPKAITKTQYWENSHKDIDVAVYKQKNIKDKANCFACHEGFEKGIFDNCKINIPK